MPKRWLLFRIDPGRVRVMTFALLFHRETAALAFDAYVAAERGDPSGLALMSMAYRYFMPSSGVWGDHASKAVSADLDPARDYFSETDPPESVIGSPMAKLAWGITRFMSWPIEPIPAEYRKLQPSDVETLLVSGSIDFSTPAEFATRELLPYLRNGRQVILAEMGHVDDVLSVNPRATERLLVSFFDTGVPDTSLYVYAPMDFSVRWGLPKIAKIGLGAAAAGTAVVAGGLVWLVSLIVGKARGRR
jgi:hypothetical protein